MSPILLSDLPPSSDSSALNLLRCLQLIFRIVENDVYKQDWRSRGKLQVFHYQVMKWVLALLVGSIVGFIGFFSNITVENIAGYKLLMTSNLIRQDR